MAKEGDEDSLYATSDEEEEDDGDLEDSGNESVVDESHQDPEASDDEGENTDSGVESGSLLDKDYRLRRPSGLLKRGLTFMYSHCGGAGIFDPKTMLFFLRYGGNRNRDNRWNGFKCACKKLSKEVRPANCRECTISYRGRRRHFTPGNHCPLSIRQLQMARFQLCQRAFFLLRRSGITREEWNFFNAYTWRRIFGSLHDWKPQRRIACFLQSCAYNGFLYPLDAKMYVARIARRGMFEHKFEYDALMFEAISFFEYRHFGFMEKLTDEDGKAVRFVLDFPYAAHEEFPSLEEPMAPLDLEKIKDFSEYFSYCFFS